MGLRYWIGRAGSGAFHLLVTLGAFSVGPLPGIHYPDPGADTDDTPKDAGAREHSPSGAAEGPSRRGRRFQGPPAGGPEQRCTTPPSRVEQELWAGLGVDVKRTGR
ncbi:MULTISPECIES: DUF6059 family protein [unclassified Streptomyces]|uniref:DUF6059 family protein n=1 Tax=unclassified Streptomyces TaxID=2593676 RepID=UPI00081D9E69|nr:MULTISPECIES: DUF6059 family protein [unclassified Streptomyces]MYZ38868.1 hypothetical protein [Streptomyces sp. SID4917]SCG00810.1 hypothetical protein GA0115259_107081 [Streptomyces sp. MnatMP-M17]